MVRRPLAGPLSLPTREILIACLSPGPAHCVCYPQLSNLEGKPLMTFLVLFLLLCQILENEHFTYKSLNIYSCKFSPKNKRKVFPFFHICAHMALFWCVGHCLLTPHCTLNAAQHVAHFTAQYKLHSAVSAGRWSPQTSCEERVLPPLSFPGRSFLGH